MSIIQCFTPPEMMIFLLWQLLWSLWSFTCVFSPQQSKYFPWNPIIDWEEEPVLTSFQVPVVCLIPSPFSGFQFLWLSCCDLSIRKCITPLPCCFYQEWVFLQISGYQHRFLPQLQTFVHVSLLSSGLPTTLCNIVMVTSNHIIFTSFSWFFFLCLSSYCFVN